MLRISLKRHSLMHCYFEDFIKLVFQPLIWELNNKSCSLFLKIAASDCVGIRRWLFLISLILVSRFLFCSSCAFIFLFVCAYCFKNSWYAVRFLIRSFVKLRTGYPKSTQGFWIIQNDLLCHYICSFCLDTKRTKKSKRFIRKSLKRHSLMH